jgi:peptidoglycan-N-acetylglucosamine deacetylase
MTFSKLLGSGFAILFYITLSAQNTTIWNGKKCAVALTYDDALHVNLDHAIPALDSVNLKGTFYLTTAAEAFALRLNEWKAASGRGHELANHTLFHPCAGNLPGRGFVTPDYDLSKYTIRRITDEIRMTNIALEAVDGKKARTFAYPCGDIKIGDTSYMDFSKSRFIAARGVKPEMLPIEKIDIYNIGSYMINGQSGQQLIDLVKKAMDTNTFLVFLFHGVGGEHSLNVSLEAHSQLLHFLKQHEREIWIAPLIDIATHIKKYQALKNSK